MASQLKAKQGAEVAFDDRSSTDAAIDMAAASLRGALLACEAELGGQMDMTLQILVRAVVEFLDDVEEAAGADVAAAYRQLLIDEVSG